jgi:hypothetical protein
MTERRFRQLWNAGKIADRTQAELEELVSYMENDLPGQSSVSRLILSNNIFKVRELIAEKKRIASEKVDDTRDKLDIDFSQR